MKGRSIPYSAEEMTWLEANRLLPISDYTAAFNATFGRDVAAGNLHALRKRKGWRTGRTGCFEKGSAPHNKGVPCAEGRGGRHPNARKTQFKQGERSGVAVKLYKPVGTERISKDGYIERKINDDKPEYKRWRMVQLIRWEAENGPVPDGHCLKCLDGDKTNTDPANWEAIPRGVAIHLVPGKYGQGFDYDHAPAELRPAILALAKVKHVSRGRRLKPALASGETAEQIKD